MPEEDNIMSGFTGLGGGVARQTLEDMNSSGLATETRSSDWATPRPSMINTYITLSAGVRGPLAWVPCAFCMFLPIGKNIGKTIFR